MNKLSTIFISICLGAIFISSSSCTHTVYDLQPKPKVNKAIKASVETFCASGVCEIGSCWQEKENYTMCNVHFSFVSNRRQRKILGRIIKDVKEKEIVAGLCAHDSFGTQLTGAIVSGLVSGALNSAISGGRPSSTYVHTFSVYDTSNPYMVDNLDVDVYEACYHGRVRVVGNNL